ncbi:MAG TPA: hypothetical protein VFJ93_00150 [Gaiellaceae bacterium]|nr:hypothetical protein [Gaiellaceae bacterium]
MRSILNAALSMPAVVFPALSLHEPELILIEEPSSVPLDFEIVGEQSARPDVTSLAANSFETALVYQPFAPFGVAGVGPLSVIDGPSVSILTVSPSLFELSASSDTEQETLCVPSLDTLTLNGDELPDTTSAVAPSVQVGAPARPLPESLTLMASETGDVMFQSLSPFAVWLTEIDGALLSIFTAGLVALFVLPALSETVPLLAVRPVPSDAIVLSAGHEPVPLGTTPEVASLHVQ